MPPAPHIDAARDATLLASLVCRQVQQSLSTIRQITKDDRSPVTIADYAAQAIVATVLTERLGPITLVGEESSTFLRQDEHRPHLEATLAAVQQVFPQWSADDLLNAIDLGRGDATHPTFWTLDPIDGTKGFLRGQQYAVSLAFIEHGQPTIGVLGCPALPRDFGADLGAADPRGCLFTAARGDGATEEYCTESETEPTAISRPTAASDDPITLCASVDTSHSDQSSTLRILEHIDGDPDVLRLDSQAKYAVVARGQADAYLRIPSPHKVSAGKPYVERIWDHAAGAVVAQECGCTVSDITGKPLDFSRGEGLESNRGIIVATPRAHGAILAAIKALGLL